MEKLLLLLFGERKKERKEPERAENPQHCQVSFKNDFLFTPYPDLQDLGSSVLFVAFLTFPSYYSTSPTN